MKSQVANLAGIVFILCLSGGVFTQPCPDFTCPPRIIAVNPSARNVLLIWQDSCSGNKKLTSQISHYVIRLRSASGNEIVQESRVPVSSVSGIQENERYSYTVCTVTKCGSEACTGQNIMKTRGSKPSAPASFTESVSVTSTTIKVFWGPPKKADRNGEITGYVLKISDNGMSKSISVNQTVTTYLFTGLSPDTLYKIKIAVENEFGRGPFEVINNRGISVKTSEDLPSAPSIKAFVFQKKVAEILLVPPSLPNGRITEYEVKSIGKHYNKTGKYPGLSNLITLVSFDLRPNATYSFSARAYTSIGPGNWSEIWKEKITPILGSTSCKPVSPNEIDTCINLSPPTSGASIGMVTVYYTPCDGSAEQQSVSFRPDLSCQRLGGLSDGTCYKIKFTANVMVDKFLLTRQATDEIECRTLNSQSPYTLPSKALLGSTNTCTVAGNHHFTTFDGLTFDYHKSCPHYLVKGQRKPFAVILELRRCTQDSCIKCITIQDFRSGLIVKLYPGENGSTMSVVAGNGSSSDMLSWIESSMRHIYLSQYGVEVIFDGKCFVQVKVPANLARELYGLCGDYNGKPGNDLVSRSIEFDEGFQFRVNRFAHFRRVQNENCRKITWQSGTTCNWASAQNASRNCWIFKDSSGLFSSCFSAVNPDALYRACVMDYCELEVRKAQLSYCGLINQYMAMCKSHEIILEAPDKCRDLRNLTDCTLVKEEVRSFEFGKGDTLQPYQCISKNRYLRKCSSSPNCKPTRSAVKELNFECIPRSQMEANTFNVTLKSPEDYSCEITD